MISHKLPMLTNLWRLGWPWNVEDMAPAPSCFRNVLCFLLSLPRHGGLWSYSCSLSSSHSCCDSGLWAYSYCFSRFCSCISFVISRRRITRLLPTPSCLITFLTRSPDSTLNIIKTDLKFKRRWESNYKATTKCKQQHLFFFSLLTSPKGCHPRQIKSGQVKVPEPGLLLWVVN